MTAKGPASITKDRTPSVDTTMKVDTEKDMAVHYEGDQSVSVDADNEAEFAKIRRKVDYRLLPPLVLLYFLAFLDRVNIGNARLWHLERDLNMDGYDYNIAVLVFYIPYILCGIPANMLLTRFRPRHWLGFLAIAWGLTVTMAGFCTNMAGLVVVRILLGVFEAGLFPAAMYLINTWYRRSELGSRMAWFMVSTDIAGASSGLLGAGLGSIDGARGYSGWSWIFFVEGAMTVICGIAVFFYLLDFPEQSNFLPEEEKAWLLRRLHADDGRNENGKMTFKGVFTALKDWKVLIAGAFYLACCVTAYSVAVFAPTILATFGWSSIKANLLSAPIRAASAIISVTIGILSDKVGRRAPFILTGYCVSIIGNCMVMFIKVGNIRYGGLYLTALGVMTIQPLVIAWSVNQVVGHNKRGTSTGFAGSMGQFGGIISALAFPKKDSPQYVPGMSVNVAFLVVGIASASWLWAWGRWENAQRDKGRRDHLLSLPQDEQDALGENHPNFRFTL